LEEIHDETLKSEIQSEPKISEPKSEKQEIEPEPVKEEKTIEVKITEPNPTPSEIKTEIKQEEVKSISIPIPIIITKNNWARELLVKARNAIQFRKRKKLDKIFNLFAKRTSITNDEVEKFLHVSDATATRYLSILEKEGKIKQSGKTGKGVSYSRI
jgi:predicted HTH transcriptional regulator